MNVPPPPPPPNYGYEGPAGYPQKPKKNPLVIVFAILGVLALCCGLPVGMIAFYGNKAFKGAMNVGGCYVNVGMMNEALDGYVKKNGKLPNAESWQKDIAPFFEVPEKEAKDLMKLWSPDGTWSCSSGETETGFSFNTEYSGKAIKDIKTPGDAIVIFETNKVGYSQSGKYEALPFNKSPKAMAEFSEERRGWIIITGELKMANIDKNGKISGEFSSEFNKGFNMKVKSGSKSEPEPASDSPADANSASE